MFISVCVFVLALCVEAAGLDNPGDPYDVLYDSIMSRTAPDGTEVGKTESSALLWYDSDYLLQDPRWGQLIVAFDGFDALTDEQIDSYPDVKRALLQRHLWEVFDWASIQVQDNRIPESKFLDLRRFVIQQKCAKVIRRVALSKDAILRLPDTLQATADLKAYPERAHPEDIFAPFLPSNINGKDSPWLCLDKTYHPIPAVMHSKNTQWRSVFLVYFRLPGQRGDAMAYLKKLTEFRDHWVTERPEEVHRTTPNGGINYVDIYVNPRTPQFPAGTQVALVERALLISDNGELVLSPLVVGIQLRAYRSVELGPSKQAVAEFVLQPLNLINGKPPLCRVGRNESRIKNAFGGGDPLGGKTHRPARLKTCHVCHSGWGIHSMNSRSQSFENRSLLPPRFVESTPLEVGAATIRRKKEDHTMGFLMGLWRSEVSGE